MSQKVDPILRQHEPLNYPTPCAGFTKPDGSPYRQLRSPWLPAMLVPVCTGLTQSLVRPLPGRTPGRH